MNRGRGPSWVIFLEVIPWVSGQASWSPRSHLQSSPKVDVSGRSQEAVMRVNPETGVGKDQHCALTPAPPHGLLQCLSSNLKWDIHPHSSPHLTTIANVLLVCFGDLEEVTLPISFSQAITPLPEIPPLWVFLFFSSGFLFNRLP